LHGAGFNGHEQAVAMLLIKGITSRFTFFLECFIFCRLHDLLQFLIVSHFLGADFNKVNSLGVTARAEAKQNAIDPYTRFDATGYAGKCMNEE
jgi:ankyrin repeat protein